MKAEKVRVRIVFRCLLGGKWRFKNPIELANHRLRALYVLEGSEPVKHPEGTYYLRFSLGKGKRTYENVGTDVSVVEDKFRKRQRALAEAAEEKRLLRKQALAAQTAVVEISEPSALAIRPAAPLIYVPRPEILPPLTSPPTLPFEGAPRPVQHFRPFRPMMPAISEWLDEKAVHTKRGSWLAYRRSIDLWAEFSQPRLYYVQDVTRADMLGFSAWLKVDQDYEDVTIFNKFRNVMGFLTWNGVNMRAADPPLRKWDWPKVKEATVEIYEPEDINPFWSACTPKEKLLFSTFVGEGFRSGEMMHVGWKNMSSHRKLLEVKFHPEYNWEPKMGRERGVPIQDGLLTELRAARATATSPLMFPADDGKPDPNMLRKAKAIAIRAGLNPDDFWLHKFRSTFATTCIRSQMADVVTVQHWMGHKNLASMQPYVKAAGCGPEMQAKFNRIEFP
jgi:integrase